MILLVFFIFNTAEIIFLSHHLFWSKFLDETKNRVFTPILKKKLLIVDNHLAADGVTSHSHSNPIMLLWRTKFWRFASIPQKRG